MKKSPLKGIIDFLGLNKTMLTMLIMVVFLGLGEKMAERFLPLYIIALGGSSISVAFLNGMDNLLSALYSFPGGYLSDRIGYKKSLIAFIVMAMIGYLIVIVFPGWKAVLVGAVFFISWSAISLPAIMSLVSKSVKKEKQTIGVSLHSLVRRIPMGLGPILGGILIGMYGKIVGVKIAFACAFVLGLMSIFFIKKYMAEDPAIMGKGMGLKESFSGINPDLRVLLASDILIRFAEQIPYAFVVLWVVDNLHFSALQFGVLTGIEMLTAMVVYIPIAFLADRYGKKPFVVITFGFFTIFPLLIYYSRTFEMLVFAFIIRGLKEFGEPARKSLILDLAPPSAKASTFGTYYLIRDVIVSMAAFSAGFLWNISPKVNFMTAFAFGITGTLFFLLFGKENRNES
ncbi:MFS transporter [Caldisericum exile]|uniref:Major facilitator superfamily protein n=1 Tax=Caldisericum exile (strain DSM 21853 / NBRC 104410 / AZM16c01) TaxID=511051 RepID=A0A7U6JFI3_CALEA|nr:MFS transporter [Caldisericum exile]BAL80165.1 major facilitator superfamily protein [Caldisericum exile AZM16c01]